MIWPQPHLTPAFLFTFASLHLPSWAPPTPPANTTPTAPVSPLFVLPVRCSEYQWGSPTDVLQTQVNGD